MIVGRKEAGIESPEGRAAAPFEIALLSGVLLAFSPALLALSEVWGSVDHYAHGYLVPPVAAAMAWSRRHESRRGSDRADVRGLALLVLALLGYAGALLAGVLLVQGLALPLALAGLALWRRGTAGLRRFAFPVAYLIFMVPVPPQWLAPVVTSLQAFVTAAAIGTFQLFELPVLREGNVIVLPEGALFVAEACSGVTSIVTLLPVAALLVFLMPLGGWRGVLLLATVVPVAMAWNLVRVLVTVVAAHHWGVARATGGVLHESAGMLTFTLGCVTLLALAALLETRTSRPGPLGEDPPGNVRISRHESAPRGHSSG